MVSRLLLFVLFFVVLSAGFALAASPPQVPPSKPCTLQSEPLLVLKVNQQACDVYLLTVQNKQGIQKMFVDGGTICAVQQPPSGSVVLVSCKSLILKGIVGETVLGTYVAHPDFKAGRLSYCFYQ
jgi:hypothetical protein